MKSRAKRTCVKVAGMAAALMAASPLMAQGIDGVIVTATKRYFLTVADARCHALDPATAMALKGGYVQARNEAIRHGRDMTVLAPYLDAARAAAGRSDCASPQLTAEMATARSAFAGFAATPRLDLAGARAAWHADRTQATSNAWRLVQYQDDGATRAAMGLYGRLSDNRLVVMARFADGAVPYSARLLLRNPAVAATGLINPAAYGVTTTAPAGFAGGTLAFPARAIGEATVPLSPAVRTNGFGFSATGAYVGEQQGPQAAVRVDFSTRAYPAIAELDPREDMVVEFDFSDGPRYVRFEVGDFITGLSYIGLPSPYGGKI